MAVAADEAVAVAPFAIVVGLWAHEGMGNLVEQRVKDLGAGYVRQRRCVDFDVDGAIL